MAIVHLAGHLGADPESRFTPDGKKVTTLRVATNTRRAGKDETTWWRVTMWGDQWDKMLPYLKKGSAVMVVGELTRAEIYTNRDGKQAISLDVRAEIVQFPPFGRRDGSQEGHQQGGIAATATGQEVAAEVGGFTRGQAPVRPAVAPVEIGEEPLPF